VRRSAPALLLLAGLTLLSAPGEAGRAELSIKGLEIRDRTAQQVEAAMLASPPEDLRSFSTRVATWMVVADSRGDWDRHVAPALEEALGTGGGVGALRDAMQELPSSIDVSGPDLDGGLVRLDLPADRGRVYVAFGLPAVLKHGRDGTGVLNSKNPNVGLFVSGADVSDESSERGERLVGLYLPGRPKPLTRGRPPAVEAVLLPDDGAGALGIFRGKGEADDPDIVTRDLKRFVGRDFLDAEMMRTFPRKGVLQQMLRTIRVESDGLVRDDDWYRTLASDPSKWRFERSTQRHPARYLAVSAPVVTVVRDGDRSQQREAIVGLVALYAPLLLTPDEAPLYVDSDPRALYEAVQRGELPFLRVERDVLFYRPWLDRWRAGRERRADGDGKRYQEARKMAFAWADRLHSRALDSAARGPLPFRLGPIPDDELEQMVDRSRRYRGRVHRSDLERWLAHFESEMAERAEPTWSLADRSEVATLRGEWATGGGPTAVASADRRPRDDRPRDDRRERTTPPARDEDREPSTPARAPEPRIAGSTGASSGGGSASSDSGELDDLGLGGERGWEADDDSDASASAADDDDADVDLDDWDSGWSSAPVPIGTGDWSGGGPATLKRLDILDVYAPSSCRPGEALDAAVELALEGPRDGEIAGVQVEWDLLIDGRNVRRDSFMVQLEAGPQEVELDVTCPESAGGAELHVALAWLDQGIQAAGYTKTSIRGGSARTYAALKMPSPKRCVEASFDDGDDDFGIQMAQGLEAEQISSSVRGFQEQTLRCHPDGGEVTGTVTLEISVGCNGRVKAATVLDDDVGDPEFATCVAQTMAFCPFPAHARDEVSFELPLRYE